MTTRSAEECEMSRSCQSATFSSPTSAFARTTRASPQSRSATTGFRLCGIAEEPFCRLPVARQNLRRGRLRTEPQPLAREALQFRIGRGVGADRTGELAHPHPFECLAVALASALELERPA